MIPSYEYLYLLEESIFHPTQIIKYCKFGSFREIFLCDYLLKDLFAMLKICDKGMIYLHQLTTRVIHPFREGFIFAKTFASAKFHENKTLAKIFEFTVTN